MSKTETTKIDELCVNAIRTLSADMVTRADSGHPGAPLGAAPMTYALWQDWLKHDPSEPEWPNRDRFILSAGHASALLYSMLHLTGYDVSIDDIKNFRQWESKTPGHPERKCAPGVEVTTGPLGQGIGNALGMALAERYLASHFNRDGYPVMDHYTYALCSDGDLMEGVSHEACSLAGHLRLGKLIALYDSNDITLDGPTNACLSDDARKRFEAYNWHVITVENGNDHEAVSEALKEARREENRPSLLLCRTNIGYASPVQDSHKAHGKPLDEDALKETKKNLGWPTDEKFHVPDEVKEHMQESARKGKKAREEWEETVDHYKQQYPDLGEEWEAAWNGELPSNWDQELPSWNTSDEPMATRDAAGEALNAVRRHVPLMVGGDADLGSSTRTLPHEGGDITADDFSHRNIRFGVREHAMAAACNGMAAHGALRPFGATFLVFSDYARPSLRLAGMMGLPVGYQFTHDSIGVGEDGPTHQPIEQLASLRAIPGWTVIRPGDPNEASEAWKQVMENTEGPTAVICSRQDLPVLDRSEYADAENVARGAYVLAEEDGQQPDVILMASGSELWKVVEARKQLKSDGIDARVVSFPSWELFEQQTDQYQEQVLPSEVTTRLAVEAGVSQGWERWVGTEGEILSVNRFGASAPGEKVMQNYGLSPDNIANTVKNLLT